MSDLGKQHNNGPRQIQIFDNPTALCLALKGRKLDMTQWGTDAPSRLFIKGVGLSFFPRRIDSVQGLPDLNITPQQLITGLFSVYTLT